MFFFDDMREMKLYNKKVQLPINLDDKLHGSAIQIFSSSIANTINILNNMPLFNTRYYKSYYIEKDMMYFVTNEGTVCDLELDYIDEADSSGPPTPSVYTPSLFTPKIQAVSGLNKPTELAAIKAIKNRNRRYTLSAKKAIYRIDRAKDTLSTTKDSVLKKNEIVVKSENSFIVDNDYLQIQTEAGSFIACTESSIKSLKESTDPMKAKLYKMMYKNRYKKNEPILQMYKVIKEAIPYIQKTYIDMTKYKNLNLFIDYGPYNEIFFVDNKFKLDKAVSFYYTYMKRLLLDDRLDKAGYKKKTILIPIDGWISSLDDLDYKNSINPISTIIRLVKKNPDALKEFANNEFIIFNNKGYFKFNPSSLEMGNINKLRLLITKLLDPKDIIIDDEANKKDSKTAIVANIVDKIETTQNVKIDKIKSGSNVSYNLVGDNVSYNLTGEIEDDTKDELIKRIEDAAAESDSEDEALEKLDSDGVSADLINQLAVSNSSNIKISAAHAARVTKVNDAFLNKTVTNKKKVSDMINTATTEQQLIESKLPVDSVNEEWDTIKANNLNKQYDPDADIYAILESFASKSIPIAIRDVIVEDTSTSEDYIDTWSVDCEDGLGQRFKLVFDIPKFKNGSYMLLRGNEKTINAQLFRLPVSKSGPNEVQLVTNYSKIFIRTYGDSVAGKSNSTTGRMIKAIDSYGKFKVSTGDNKRISDKYDVPIDYYDLSSVYTKIDSKKVTFIFNLDTMIKDYKADMKKGLPLGIEKANKEILYYDPYSNTPVSVFINGILKAENEEYAEIYNSKPLATRYVYSKASILNTEIPVIVLLGYANGLEPSLKKAGIIYQIKEKRESFDKDRLDVIRFKDAYLYYENTYAASMLLNGLKECDTVNYSITEANDREMYLDFLDQFGGRLKSDGLDNFSELFVDPISKSVCEKYKLPNTYVDMLIYANNLLVDTKYTTHNDMSAYRYRRNEIIASYAYNVLSKDYGTYRTKIKKTGKGTMVVKKTAIVDAVMADNNTSDFSYINDLYAAEAVNTISTKGLSGMNTDRGYTLDKRSYDDSMANIIGMSTGFAGTVGISRQTTLDMNVDTTRGYLKQSDAKKDIGLKSLTVSEALTPLMSTRDDPFRQAMTFVQTTKHTMRTSHSTPSLITNGMDQALPFMTANMFSYKAKADGKVLAITEDYMIVEYKDGTRDMVNLSNQVKKNSDAGIYANLKLDTDLKVGKIFKANDILAYDKLSYSNEIGDGENINYCNGTLAKMAILTTDEGFEDSAIISDWLAGALSSEVVHKVDRNLSKDTNVLFIAKKGDYIQEGDPLLIYQTSFEDDSANQLLKNLSADNDDINELGRIPLKSKITGKIEDIRIYRTVEKDELSDSLRKVVNTVEAPITAYKKVMKQNGIIDETELPADYKLEPTGKLKSAKDGIRIEFYLTQYDRMSIGDKIVFYSALKGVIKDLYPVGQEPYTDFRPDESIHAFMSLGSPDGRMVTSVFSVGAVNKALIELDRAVKDLIEEPWTEI